MDILNCNKFRLSTYKEHIVTGEMPKKDFYLTRYFSADHGGWQKNYSIKIGLTTFHFKWRSYLGNDED